MGIQQMEAQIMQKAKRDAKKIEDFKRRFRESATGNQFTSQLRNYSDEKIKDKLRELEERMPSVSKQS